MVKILTLLILILALSTIASINPVNSVIGLISVFILSSIYLAILSSNFLALSYIIIYVGAIAILLLFVVMMMNIKYIETEYPSTLAEVSEGTIPQPHWGRSAVGKPLRGLPTGSSPLAIILTSGFVLESELFQPTSPEPWYTSGTIRWDDSLLSSSQIEAIGYNIYSNSSIWLIILSVLLLLAMMGPILLVHQNQGDEPSSPLPTDHQIPTRGSQGVSR